MQLPRLDDEIENFGKFLEDPRIENERHQSKQNPKKTKMHVVSLVTTGHILGIEEEWSNSETHTTGAVCLSLEAELLKIDRDLFNKAIAS